MQLSIQRSHSGCDVWANSLETTLSFNRDAASLPAKVQMFAPGASPPWLPDAPAGAGTSTFGSRGLLKQQPPRQPVEIHLLQPLLCRAAEKVFYIAEQPSWLVHEISSAQGRRGDVLHPTGRW